MVARESSSELSFAVCWYSIVVVSLTIADNFQLCALLLLKGPRELAQVRQEVLDIAEDLFSELALERKNDCK